MEERPGREQPRDRHRVRARLLERPAAAPGRPRGARDEDDLRAVDAGGGDARERVGEPRAGRREHHARLAPDEVGLDRGEHRSCFVSSVHHRHLAAANRGDQRRHGAAEDPEDRVDTELMQEREEQVREGRLLPERRLPIRGDDSRNRAVAGDDRREWPVRHEADR